MNTPKFMLDGQEIKPFNIFEYAVLNSCALILEYDGKVKRVCPYLLGVTKENKQVLHAFQFGGEDSRGEVTPESGTWKYLYVDKIGDGVNLILGNQTWYPLDFKKSDIDTYKPPKFIVKILAIHEK